MSRLRSLICLLTLLAAVTLHGPPTAAAVVTACTGDCGGDWGIDVGELIVAVKVVLGDADPSACPSIACESDDSASVACVVGAVENALRGSCQEPVLEYHFCGNTVCDLGEVCCNPLYSLCARPDQYCIQ